MAAVTYFLTVTCALLMTSAHGQTGAGAMPMSIVDFINSMTQGNNNQALGPTFSSSSSSSSSSSGTGQPSQLSLVESFGPISSQTIATGTSNAGSVFSPPPQPAHPSVTQNQPSGTQQMQQVLMQQQQQASGLQTGPSVSGANVAQFFGSGGSGAAGGSNSISGGSAASPGSEPLGNDILSKVAAFVNQGMSSGTPAAPSSAASSSTSSSSSFPSVGTGQNPNLSMDFGGMSPMGSGVSVGSSMGSGLPPMGGLGGLGGMGGAGLPSMAGDLSSMGSGGLQPPMSAISGMMSSMMMNNPIRNQAMLRVGRRMGQRFGVNQYYEIHGCEDPTTLFSGRQKIMATLAMAQGCQSLRAIQICKMAQVKERIGNSLLTSRVIPPQMRSRLESCLSAKVLFTSMQPMLAPQSFGLLSEVSTGAPSLRECGMLLATVMDGGALDPESMISTRRRMLPWSCNESNMGPNGIPYRVCCPGKVLEPTLQEAHILRRMMNA